ncbi:hypothetical protein [Flavobacterium sp.]
MKKRVEAELISIAHRVLKLKNKSEIDQLYKETQKLYEALTILKFYGENYEMLKNSISAEEIEEKVAVFIESNAQVQNQISKVESQPETQPETQPDIEEELLAALEPEVEIIPEAISEDPIIIGEIVLDEEEEDEVLMEDSSEEESFIPSFELSFEEEKIPVEEQVVVEKTAEIIQPKKQVTMDDVFGDHFKEPVFVKPEDNVQSKFVKVFDETVKSNEDSSKILSLNDSLTQTISVGLNDRIGFVKHLFNDSNEDYNRVLSQLNTFDTFAEAKNFLNEMVIPDYNYWVGKEEYLERFMEILEKKFK